MKVNVRSFHMGLLREDFETIASLVGAALDSAGVTQDFDRSQVEAALSRYQRHYPRLRTSDASPDAQVLLFVLIRSRDLCGQPDSGAIVAFLLREAMKILDQLFAWFIDLDANAARDRSQFETEQNPAEGSS